MIRMLVVAALCSACASGNTPAAAPQPSPETAPMSLEGYTFPPEWAAQEAMWIGWDPQARPDLVAIYVEMIGALVKHVPVVIATTEAGEGQARTALAEAEVSLDRIVFRRNFGSHWVRDPGPLFLKGPEGLRLLDFRWTEYGYGYPLDRFANRYQRSEVNERYAEQLEIPLVQTDYVAEGGGLEVSSTVLMSYADYAQQRNPTRSLEAIERELLRVYGKKKMIWLSRSPFADKVFPGPKIANVFGFGANGHIDEFARFANERTILVGYIPEEERTDPLSRADGEILDENRRELEAARDLDGRPFEVIPVPMPDTRILAFETTWPKLFWLKQMYGESYDEYVATVFRDFGPEDPIRYLPATSYLNFVLTDGLVLLPAYGGEGQPEALSERDAAALAIFEKVFPDREIVQIPSLPLNWQGGGMHCITQQQPKPD